MNRLQKIVAEQHKDIFPHRKEFIAWLAKNEDVYLVFEFRALNEVRSFKANPAGTLNGIRRMEIDFIDLNIRLHSRACSRLFIIRYPQYKYLFPISYKEIMK